ncbi:hypothetical protein LP419_16140 [Massilia sp. H-1]|nr:hypothetical protein LP419_16140 [Massilia sp. H-1]
MLCLLALTSLLFCGLVLVVLSSVAGRLARLLTRNGNHALRWERRVKLATLIALLCVIGVMAYRAINPGDARYLEEFSEVSLRPPCGLGPRGRPQRAVWRLAWRQLLVRKN